MTLNCPYFLPEVMVKLTRVRGHFVTHIEVNKHLIQYINLDVSQRQSRRLDWALSCSS